MSLLWRRRAIERAAAGLLPAAEEQRLRAHVGRCERCRAHYNQLTVTARALKGAPAQATMDQAARERQRLVLALAPPAPAPSRAPAAVRRRWVLVLAPALAAAVVLLVVRSRQPGHPVDMPSAGLEEDVRWRGSSDRPGGAAKATVLVYATPKDGGAERRVRMVAEFPGSSEGIVSRGDYVQFTARHDFPRAFVTLLGVDARGTIHRYFPRPGAPAQPHAPGASAGPLGPSLDLGSSHPPGPLRLLALFSEAPLDEARVREAIAAAPLRAGQQWPHEWSLALPAHQVMGLLLVRP